MFLDSGEVLGVKRAIHPSRETLCNWKWKDDTLYAGGKGIRRGKLEEEEREENEDWLPAGPQSSPPPTETACLPAFFWPGRERRKEGRREGEGSIENEEGIISLPISNCGFD